MTLLTQTPMNSLVVCQATNSVDENHLGAVNLTENYAKHTFQAPCSCFKSGLTKDILLFKTIYVSID